MCPSLHIDSLLKKLSIFGHVMDSAPSPSQTTWSSESVAKVKEMYCVKVESMTSKGERYPYGGLQAKAELRPKSHDGAVVPGEVEDHGDGTYTITSPLRLLVLTSSSSQWMVNMYRTVLATLMVEDIANTTPYVTQSKLFIVVVIHQVLPSMTVETSMYPVAVMTVS